LCLFQLSQEVAETIFLSTSISSDAAPFEDKFDDDQLSGEGEEEVGDDGDEMADSAHELYIQDFLY
jgi:hypothetical protein